MKQIKYILTILSATLFITPILAKPASNVETIEPQEQSSLQFKVADKVEPTKDTNGSSILIGQDVHIKTIIKGISFSTGATVIKEGTSDYVLTAGNNVTIKGNIKNDAFIAGNYIMLKETSIIGRDAFIAGNEIEIAGQIDRDLTIIGSTVNIKNATIKGNVTIYATTINIEPSVRIDKLLKHGENAIIKISPEAKINATEKFDDKIEKTSFIDQSYNRLISTVSILAVFVTMAILTPNILKKLDKKISKLEPSTPFANAGKGALILIGVPVISILLFVTGIGSPLALILLLIYFLGMYLSPIFVGYLIGHLIWNKLTKKEQNPLQIGLIGIMILYVVSLIPIINSIISFATILIGLGMFFDLLKTDKK